MCSRCCRIRRRPKWCASRSSKSATNTPRRFRTRRRCCGRSGSLQRQQASLSADALNQKGRDFQQKVNELDTSVQGKRQALERSNAEALEKIQGAMLKIITDLAKEKKRIWCSSAAELVLFDQGFDVTDYVLQKLDETAADDDRQLCRAGRRRGACAGSRCSGKARRKKKQ